MATTRGIRSKIKDQVLQLLIQIQSPQIKALHLTILIKAIHLQPLQMFPLMILIMG